MGKRGTSGAKAHDLEKGLYRSGKPLRHPKADFFNKLGGPRTSSAFEEKL
jgi:hypothetical protein